VHRLFGHKLSCHVLMEAGGAAGSGADLVLKADGGTFGWLTAVLALTEARGAARPEGSLLWGADFVGIGWLCITTFLRSGACVAELSVSAFKLIQQQSQSSFEDICPRPNCQPAATGW
jgi:hypothetical protein